MESYLRMTFVCSEKLDLIDSEQAIYHCKNCKRNLHDFRNRSEAEMNEIIKTNNGNVCGVFNEEQVYITDPNHRSFWTKGKIWISTLLFSIGTFLSLNAKEVPQEIIKTESQQFIPKPIDPNITKDSTRSSIRKERRAEKKRLKDNYIRFKPRRRFGIFRRRKLSRRCVGKIAVRPRSAPFKSSRN